MNIGTARAISIGAGEIIDNRAMAKGKKGCEREMREHMGCLCKSGFSTDMYVERFPGATRWCNRSTVGLGWGV